MRPKVSRKSTVSTLTKKEEKSSNSRIGYRFGDWPTGRPVQPREYALKIVIFCIRVLAYSELPFTNDAFGLSCLCLMSCPLVLYTSWPHCFLTSIITVNGLAKQSLITTCKSFLALWPLWIAWLVFWNNPLSTTDNGLTIFTFISMHNFTRQCFVTICKIFLLVITFGWTRLDFMVSFASPLWPVASKGIPDLLHLKEQSPYFLNPSLY